MVSPNVKVESYLQVTNKCARGIPKAMPHSVVSSKCSKRLAQKLVPSRPKALHLVVNPKVLAERNQPIVPVGAWVECARDCEIEEGVENHALVSAPAVEQTLKELQREKWENLRRFQEKVRWRLNQQAYSKKHHQLQKSFEAVEKEGRVMKQASEAAQHLTPKRNTCVFRSFEELAIRSPGSRLVSAQGVWHNEKEDEDEIKSEVFQQQAKKLSKVRRKARHKLSLCQIIPEGEPASELPGGIWRISPTRDNPVSRRQIMSREEKADMAEVPLTDQHDLPADLLQVTEDSCEKAVSFANFQEERKVCDRLLREPYPAGSCPGFTTSYRPALVLRPGIDHEENKKQRQNQYLMYRRLFMDMERQQVKEQQRQKEHRRRIAKIKEEKELERQEEEERMHREMLLKETDPASREDEIEARLREEEEMESKAKARKHKEGIRFIEALRAQMKERVKFQNMDLPLLCYCGTDFWDTHPDKCANNCIFYRNPKAYARALQSVLSSCDLGDGTTNAPFSTRRITSTHTASPRK
ncbi:coiled-coil domain-containing protein 15 isoform X2 [Protopterus annectens]|uniref:coiled-coil domain-containing protein 15 isoform X2 n=1 Tax=Protopterus annectens TaxID=7888 RepID=UPI001CFA6985|nr:coiled-coil domain-containing protein 15 isoform X2 [Protopterus annectens]